LQARRPQRDIVGTRSLNFRERKETNETKARWFAKSLLVGMVVLLVMMPAGAAFAAPPEHWIYHYELDYPWIDCGDFTINEQAVMDVRVTDYYDKDGNRTREVEHYAWNGIVYNSLHPEILLVEKPTHYKVGYDPDGLQTWVGLFINIHVPGQGPVFRGSGRELAYWIDGDYYLTFWAGPSDYIEGDTDALCAALRVP
jgi:hypothetical protein